MLRKLWKWLAASFSVVAILMALAIGLFRLLLPLIPHYHERIEAFASEAAGTAVRIERVAARWGMKGPELRFENARLLTATGDQVLFSASEGRVVLDLGALLQRRELRAGQVLLDGLVLEVSRDADRVWRIGGRALTGDGDDDLPARLSLGLRDAQVVFRDAITGAGPWVFDDVQLDVDLRRTRLVIDSDLRLPPGLGSEAQVSIRADGDTADFENLQWQAYFRAKDLDLFGWTPLMPAGRVHAASGRGDVVLWFSALGSKPQQATLRSDLRDVEMTLGGRTLRDYDQLSGRLQYDRTPGGWEASGHDLVIGSGEAAWPGSSFSIESVDADENGLLYADIEYARLEDIAPFLDWMPDPALRARMAALAPHGEARDLSLRINRRAGELDNFSFRAAFDDIGFSAHEKLPGFAALSGQVRLDANGGRVQLEPRPVVIELPEILGEPLRTQRLSGAVLWRRGPGGWLVVSDHISIDHEYFDVASDFELTLGDEETGPVLSLHAGFGEMQLRELRGLLPRPLLPERVAQWLSRALVAGEVQGASIDFDGALSRFPFDAGDGEFRAELELRGATINYADQWPPATEVDGTVVFHNASVRGGVTRAQLAGNRISSAELAIPDLRQAVFELHTVADGLLDSLHGFLVATPVAQRSGSIFSRLQLSGDGSAKVDLALPLSRKLGLETDLSVIVSTESGQVGLQGWQHQLEQVAGSLQYRNGEFSARDIKAQVLGAPASVDISPGTLDTGERTYRATTATVRGAISHDNLALLNERLRRVLDGQTPYTATLTIPDRTAALPISLAIATRLEGMAVNLPAPLHKEAPSSRNLRLNIALPEQAARTDAIYGDIANARLNWVHGGNGWKLDRGGVHFGLAPAELPDGEGLAITGVVSRFDLGSWLGLLSSDDAGGGNNGILRGLRIEAGTLDAFGQRLRDARLTVDRSEREWLVQVDSDVASGALFVPFDLKRGPIIANMQVLHLGAGDDAPAGPADTQGDDDTDPRQVPALTVQADDFRLGDMRLGRLTAQLEPDADGVMLREFTTQNDSFNTTGRGLWERTQGGQRTELALTLISTDTSATLTRLGFDGVIDASAANVEMSLNWPGPPGRQVREHVNGVVSVSVGPGQIDTVNPGAGRALGLFSFTALPRRLSLDFRDVFDKGFGFDYIEGDFRLENGNAYTSNLVLEGPAAQVGIAGRTGLAARDYDQTAVVYGNFGAALPVAGALAGGPIGGAAMLIFSELFKRPLQNMARINYRITGSWDEPAIERVLAPASDGGAS